MSPNTIHPNNDKRPIVLIGNPNVGKSLIFKRLTGTYAVVSNFPGTTVDIMEATATLEGRPVRVIDSPGIISLHAKTDEERVTRDAILDENARLLVHVGDAKNLAKTLHLTFEAAAYQIPMVLVLNMADEARDRGIRIDTARLSSILGIPVVETVAVTGEGIKTLMQLLLTATVPKKIAEDDSELAKLRLQIEAVLELPRASEPLAQSLLAGEPVLESRLRCRLPAPKNERLSALLAQTKKWGRPPEILFFENRQKRILEIVGEVMSRQRPGGRSWLPTLGNFLLRPVPGALAAVGSLVLMYYFVGVFGAGYLVNFLEKVVFGEFLAPFFKFIVNQFVPFNFFRQALVGPYGLLTMALPYAVALILPIVATFFFFFGLLEDSGYLPRLAVMMDRVFRLMGLNGRAVLPMVLGLGCDTMATVTTRILDTKREKFLVSLLLTLAVPCSAQLGAILGMSAGQGLSVVFIWFFIIAGTLVSVGWGAARLLPGSRSPFLIDIPPLRIPTMANIFKKIQMRLVWYLKEVIPLFMMATFALFLLDWTHVLLILQKWFSPVVVHWLGLPEESTSAFLIGFFRRDYGAAGFFQLARAGLLNRAQVAVSMVVITLFMPCVAHFLVTIRERGLKVTLGISAFVMGYALAIGGVLNFVLMKIRF